MNLRKEDWLGTWTSFERLLESREPAVEKAWQEAEDMALRVPALAKMFGGSAKAFWAKACATNRQGNPQRLTACHVTETEKGMYAEWFDEKDNSLGRYRYQVLSILKNGLEGKENAVFFAKDAPDDWPFRYVIAMAPLPERSAHKNGGLLSHMHFQFASELQKLTDGIHLVEPMWYPTVCDGNGTLLEQCNLIRALHKLPVWDQLPEECAL